MSISQWHGGLCLHQVIFLKVVNLSNKNLIRSVGNLIASTCFDGDSRYVWFFERNGQFRTNSKNFKVPNFAENVDKSIASTVQWNLDSSVFMICLTDQSKNLSHRIKYLFYSTFLI